MTKWNKINALFRCLLFWVESSRIGSLVRLLWLVLMLSPCYCYQQRTTAFCSFIFFFYFLYTTDIAFILQSISLTGLCESSAKILIKNILKLLEMKLNRHENSINQILCCAFLILSTDVTLDLITLNSNTYFHLCLHIFCCCYDFTISKTINMNFLSGSFVFWIPILNVLF